MPIAQAVVLAVCCLVFQFLAFLIRASTGSEDVSAVWIISAACVLFFAFLNAILALQAESVGTYVVGSFSGYFLVLLGCVGIAYGFALGSTDGAESIRFIFAIITFAYFIFLTIAVLMRKIIDYAQRQDTEHKT